MRVWGIPIFLMAGLLIGCGTREDYSTPRAAVRTFYIALMTGDTATARAAVCDSHQGEAIEDMRALVTGIMAAQEAAVAQFGSSGQSVSGGLPSLSDLDEATESIRGEAAELIGKSAAVRRVYLRKVDGRWKLDLFATLEMKPEEGKRLMHLAAKMAAALPEKIKAGQYKSAQEAETALRQSLIMAAAGERLKGLFR